MYIFLVKLWYDLWKYFSSNEMIIKNKDFIELCLYEIKYLMNSLCISTKDVLLTVQWIVVSIHVY